MSSVDSVAFRFMRPQPSSSELRERGWSPRYDTRLGTVSRWVLPPEKGTHNPNLTWSKPEEGTGWVTSEVSLPKHLHGSNTVDLKQEDLELALESVSEYTSAKTGQECNALNGIVGRVDYAENFQVGQKMVPAYLEAVLDGRIPHFRPPFRQGDSTVLFTTKSSRAVQLYDKFEETSYLVESGRATEEDLDKAKGVLRLESRFRTTQSCSRLAKSLDIGRDPKSLLSSETARRVIKMEVSKLTLDKPVVPVCGRLEALFQYFKDAKIAGDLYGFLAFRDLYGEGFWRNPELKMSKPTYDRSVKKLKEAGMWLNSNSSKSSLPPLSI